MAQPWTIERLEKRHDRSAFRSGIVPLDSFLATLAGQYEKRNLGITYVATRPAEAVVLGFYTVSSAAARCSR